MYYPLTNFTVCWRFEINHQICWICRFINCANRNCLYSMNDFILKWNGFYLDQENYARWGRDRDNKRLSLRGITVDIFENPLIIVKTCFSDQIWNQEHYLPRVNPVWLTVNGIWGGWFHPPVARFFREKYRNFICIWFFDLVTKILLANF